MADGLSLRRELIRKLIHIAASIIPIAYYLWVEWELIIIFTVCLSIGFLAADILRMYFSIVRKYFRRIFSALLRENEANNQLTGATYLFMGISVALIVFEKKTAVCSALMVTLADPVAAMVGKWIGTTPILGKTVQGSLAFFITAVIITGFLFGLHWQIFIIAALITIIELLPMKINDNLTIPVAAGVSLYIAF